VHAYIAAMPDWKRDVERCVDALIVRTVRPASTAAKNDVEDSLSVVGARAGRAERLGIRRRTLT
jgi:hypothetical protein